MTNDRERKAEGFRALLAIQSKATQLLASRPVRRIKSYSESHRHVVAGLFFAAGFVWDVLTLQRIDAWFDNLLLFLYLVALSVLILFSARAEFGDLPDGRVNPVLGRRRMIIRDGLQFLMGALFSAFVVFYGQSASLSRTSVYLALLVTLLIANEFVHRRAFNITLLLSLYFLASASFLIFFLPVLLGHMGFASFATACALSAGLTVGLGLLLKRTCHLPGRAPVVKATVSVLGIAALLNILYLTNLMPPVPLAMKFGGIYHNVYSEGDVYHLTYEQQPWYRFWSKTSQPFHYVEGDPVYCFAAVFAPTDFREQVHHSWQYKDDKTGDWIQTDRIEYDVLGGRDRGFRGFTVKRTIKPGTWRVLVEDVRGFVLGKISFDVVAVDTLSQGLVEELYR